MKEIMEARERFIWFLQTKAGLDLHGTTDLSLPHPEEFLGKEGKEGQEANTRCTFVIPAIVKYRRGLSPSRFLRFFCKRRGHWLSTDVRTEEKANRGGRRCCRLTLERVRKTRLERNRSSPTPETRGACNSSRAALLNTNSALNSVSQSTQILLQKNKEEFSGWRNLEENSPITSTTITSKF